MYRIIEFLIYHLPEKWYMETQDTSCVSWGTGQHCLAARYWPLECCTIRLGRWARTWWA